MVGQGDAGLGGGESAEGAVGPGVLDDRRCGMDRDIAERVVRHENVGE